MKLLKFLPLLALLPSMLHAQPNLIILNDDRFLSTTGTGGWSDNFFCYPQNFDTNDCSVREGCVAPGIRKLLGFDVTVVNIGDQRLTLPNSVDHPELFQFDPCHGHTHLLNFCLFELLDCSGKQVATGQKLGWCVLSNIRFMTNGPVTPGLCGCDSPCMEAGWGDTYRSGTPCMWIDVTSIPDGYYTLRCWIDPLGIYGVKQNVSQALNLQGTVVTKLSSLPDCSPPLPPTNFTVTTSKQQNMLRWSDSTATEIQRRIYKQTNLVSDWMTLAKTGPGVTSYSDGAIRKPYSYKYQIRSFNSFGNSPWVSQK